MKKINFDDSKTSWAPFTWPLISVFLFANLVGSWPQDMMWDFMVYTNSATTSAKDVKQFLPEGWHEWFQFIIIETL